MATDKTNKDSKRPSVDEEYLMNLMSGDEPYPLPLAANNTNKQHSPKNNKSDRNRAKIFKKAEYEELFLVNRFPAGRYGKVVYIRPEFHERLLRIVQLTREEKVTLYSYIDNILEYHFQEFGDEITEYFNNKFKPIL